MTPPEHPAEITTGLKMKGSLLYLRWLAAAASGFSALCAHSATPGQPVFHITDFTTCQDAKTEAPHDWHIPSHYFLTTDDKFFAWVEVTNVSGVHSVEMKAFRPDGTWYGQETQTIIETNGLADWWRMSAWWRIKDDKPADTPGRWKLALLIDGVLQRSIYFNLAAATPAQTLTAQSAGQNLTVHCVIESSSDLANWTPISTNALPASLLSATAPPPSFRLALSASAPGACILEASTNPANWIPIQTNTLPQLIPDPTVVTAQFYRAVIRR